MGDGQGTKGGGGGSGQGAWAGRASASLVALMAATVGCELESDSSFGSGATGGAVTGASGGFATAAASGGASTTGTTGTTGGTGDTDTDSTSSVTGADTSGARSDASTGATVTGTTGVTGGASGSSTDTPATVTNPLEVCGSPALGFGSQIGVDSSKKSHSITVPNAVTVTDVDVLLNVTHAYMTDVRARVSHGGVTRTVFDQNNHGQTTTTCPNMNAYLDDETGQAIAGVCPGGAIGSGSYRPYESLTPFDGLAAAGDWTIEVWDDVTGDKGTLNSWCVRITWQ